MSTESAASRRDQRVHAEVCLTARPGESWLDRCTCGATRARHEDLTHRAIGLGPSAACSGRNSAGECRDADCACPRFTARRAT